MNIYGYARVSTAEQHVDRQIKALLENGIPKDHIFVDKLSGKDFNRPQWKKLRRKLRPGDLLKVKSIDRIGRDYDEISEEWRYITKVIGADIVSLDEMILDTRMIQTLIEKLVTDIIFSVQTYVAENERIQILRRQAEGIIAAKARGVRFGRPELPKPENYREVMDRWLEGEISARKAAAELKVNHKTFLKWGKQEESMEKPYEG
ncbi:MAG: recombinase family protein [Anaerolineaceae bacterium]|nr:recombinase family protein [Anaerolineaceae bacterium]